MPQKVLKIQNTKLFLKMTISNLKNKAIKALSKLGLAKSDTRQLP